jgi:hypothetical protein
MCFFWYRFEVVVVVVVGGIAWSALAVFCYPVAVDFVTHAVTQLR